MASAIDWNTYEQLKALGLADREIARRWEIPWRTFHREKQRHTGAHPSTPMPPELLRVLSLLPDLEVMVARERDRQRLLSTPIGTPRHTQKKTYVVDSLYVDLIERYAQAEGVELKDVVNLAFHEFFGFCRKFCARTRSTLSRELLCRQRIELGGRRACLLPLV
jgi:hypothetical protein